MKLYIENHPACTYVISCWTKEDFCGILESACFFSDALCIPTIISENIFINCGIFSIMHFQFRYLKFEKFTEHLLMPTKCHKMFNLYCFAWYPNVFEIALEMKVLNEFINLVIYKFSYGFI